MMMKKTILISCLLLLCAMPLRAQRIQVVDGDGLAPPGAEVAQGKGGVEAQPVQALRAKATEVLAVALFAVPAVAAQ